MAYTNPGKALKGNMPSKGATKDGFKKTESMGTSMKKPKMMKKKK